MQERGNFRGKLRLSFFLVRQQKDEEVGGSVLGGAKGKDRAIGVEDW